MSGDVRSFDRKAFSASLAAALGVDTSSVVLTLRPGSVVVTATVAYANGLPPNLSTAVIVNMGTAAASAAGAKVLVQPVATLGAVTVDASPPSPPPPPPGRVGVLDDSKGAAITTESGELEDWAIGLIAAGVVLAGVIVIAGAYYMCKKTKQSVTLSSPVPVTMMVSRNSDTKADSASATANVEAVEVESKM